MGSPMGDAPAFIRAIREHPLDVTPRLVFADWLDEHGQPVLAEAYRASADPDVEYAHETGLGSHWHVRLWMPESADFRYRLIGIWDSPFEAVQGFVRRHVVCRGVWPKDRLTFPIPEEGVNPWA